MLNPEAAASKYSIQFGTVTGSQIIAGDHNTVNQRIGLSPQEALELHDLFAGLRSTVEQQAPADIRDEAVANTAELEQALVSEQPDPGTVRRVLRWFKEHAPQLAGAVIGVVINPLVGAAVEGAGSALADSLRTVIEEEVAPN